MDLFRSKLADAIKQAELIFLCLEGMIKRPLCVSGKQDFMVL
jgi:hypothetical protein